MPNGSIQYHYDESGRLKEKQLPNGITTAYTYNRTGRLEQLSHTGKGHTEKYSYSYDAAGNKTGANRHRPDMEADSGSYGYMYDSLMRLTEVTKDGEPLRSYSYDTYGNRTGKIQYGSEEPVMTTYRYNAGNQLIKQTDPEQEQTYFYDKRGNLTAVKSGEELIKAYTYDAANLMSGSYGTADGTKKHAEYHYNGLGQRVSQSIYGNVTAGAMTEPLQGKPETPESRITYILDLTRPYHNLLQTEENAAEKKQSFYWDAGVAAMEEKGEAGYYLLDDLGSPMELMDEAGTVMESYGFDEFGCNILPGKEPSAINTGTVETIQPFGFTGYQTDKVGGLYFAQARRYDADAGRFVSEDKIKGNAFLPISINAYLYCRMNPLKYIDPSGNDCYIFYSKGNKDDAKNEKKQLKKQYGLNSSQVHLIEVSNNDEFIEAWDSMGIENGEEVSIDTVSIFLHGNTEQLQYKRVAGERDDRLTGDVIEGLEEKSMDILAIYGCNSGNYDYIGTNPASKFSQIVNGAPVLASDGTVYIFNWWEDSDYKGKVSKGDKNYKQISKNRASKGWIIYQYIDGEVKVIVEFGEKIYIRDIISYMEFYNAMLEGNVTLCPD